MFETVTPQQQTALRVLVRGGTAEDACRQANAEWAQVTAWLDDPHFLSALHHARTQLWQELMGQLQQAAARGVEVLLEVMQGCNDARVRIRAAHLLIQLAAKAQQEETRRDEGREKMRQNATEPDMARHGAPCEPEGIVAQPTNRADGAGHSGAGPTVVASCGNGDISRHGGTLGAGSPVPAAAVEAHGAQVRR